jgi:hypothetical protein
MNRWRFPLLTAVCLTALASPALWSAPAPSERSLLEQVPASAPIVTHMRGLQGTRDRFVAMMENALPEVLKQIQPEIDDFLKNGKDGRKVRGLAKDGPHFLAITELPKAGQPVAGPPPMAVILALGNYKEFRDSILTDDERKDIKDKGNGIESATLNRETMYFVDRKTYVVVTAHEDVAMAFTKKQTGLNTKMSKEQAAKFLASDFGVYVNMETINKDYGEQIKQGRDGIEQALGPLAAIGDESQKKMVETLKKAIGPIFQGIEDMQSVLWSVEFRPGGLAVHLQSELRDSTPTAQLLKDSRPVAFKELERLPEGRTMYSALKTSAALYKGLGSLMAGIPLGKSGEESKEVAAALDELAKAGPNVRLDGYSFPMAGLQVYEYDDPAKAVAAQVKLFKALAAGDAKDLGLKEKPTLKVDAETCGDFKLHSVEMAWDFEKMAEQVAKAGDEQKKQYIESMKGLLGEKMMLWFGTDGKTVVQVVAKDWPSARKLLDQYSKGKGTVGEAKTFRDARKEMPARTSFLGLIDSVHLVGSLVEAFRPMIPAGQVPPGWPNMPDKRVGAYVGFAVTLQPRRGSFDVFVSAVAAQEFYKAIVKPLVPQ